MKKSHKILILIAVLIVAVISITCLVGFTIGGKFGWWHMLLFFLISLVLTMLSLLFVNGKAYLKTSKFREPLVLVTLSIFIAFFAFYGWANFIGASNDAVIYDTIVEYDSQYSRTFTTDIGFLDENGVMQETKDHSVLFDEKNPYPQKGSTITVQQRQGAFGYPVFKIINVKEDK